MKLTNFVLPLSPLLDLFAVLLLDLLVLVQQTHKALLGTGDLLLLRTVTLGELVQLLNLRLAGLSELASLVDESIALSCSLSVGGGLLVRP